MALPSPTTTWRLVKFLLRESAYAIPAGLAWLETHADASEAAPDPHWIRAVVSATRNTPTGTSEDVATFKLDLLNITGGAIDSSWTYSDLAAVDAKIQTFLTYWQGHMSANHRFTRIGYYDMSFNPEGDLAKPFRDSGPPVGVTTISKVGAATQYLPYQVAMSITFKTAWPKHWGRIYMPGPSGSAGFLDSNGRFDSAFCTSAANAAEQMISDLAGLDFLTVVPVGQLDKSPFHALLGIGDVQVDDIPDVQRRRRPKMAAVRALGTHT